MSLLSELKRRNVVRVAITYGVASWLIVQLADVLGSLLQLPAWTGKLVVFLLSLGLPVALVMSWIYDVTPGGLARTGDVGSGPPVVPQAARRLDRMIMAGLVIAILVLLAQRHFPPDTAEQPVVANTDNSSRTTAPRLRSIAVLPFTNMSDDPANEYFSDGMSEEILNTLARIDGIKVAARTASFQFKGRTADIADIGRRLNVGAVLEGSVRKSGDSVRISARLVDVTDGYRVWSRTFDRSPDDVFAVQTEIANEIVDALQIELDREGGKQAAARVRALPSQNPRAYELFLQGRHLWRQRNAPALTTAVSILRDAVKLDPQFAEAYAALASACYVLPTYVSVDVPTMYDCARSAAERAEVLDSTLSEPVAVFASMEADRRHWGAAERGLRRAIELEPDQAIPHHWLALVYLYVGNLRSFSTEIQRAYELDPTNAAITGLVGVSYHLAGDFPAAIHYYELSGSMGGVFASIMEIPHAYYDAGQPERALDVARRGYASAGLGAPLAELIHAAMNDPAKRKQARTAILSAPRHVYTPLHRLFDLLRIGDYEFAVDHARGSPDAVPGDLLYSAWYASSREFRRAPAFRRLLRESGVLDYWRDDGWPELCHPRGDDVECR